eukprot:scaffold28101_cov67-Phaeocystis_antarctica.AAC.1
MSTHRVTRDPSAHSGSTTTWSPPSTVRAASHGQARHPSPRTGDRVECFDCVAKVAIAVATADRIDLACYRRDCQGNARSWHARQRLPAVGLRVVHLRFSRHYLPVKPTHDVELATQSRSAVSAALRGHAGDLAPRIERRVVGQHRAELSLSSSAVPAHQVDPARPEAQAPQRLQSTDGHHCLEQHALPFDREQRWPCSNADVLHDRHQLGLGPLGSLPPTHDPLEDGLFVLGHQHLLLHQRQHLRARGQLRRQLLEAAKRRLHRCLLESRQGEDVGEPPHVEGIGGRELGGHHGGARRLEWVDHQPCRRVEHLGQLALLDLAGALVQESQHRLEHGRADALERVRGIRSVAHARVKETAKVTRAGGQHDAVRLALDALGTDDDVGEAGVAPERGERRVVRLAAAQRELGCGGGGAGGAGALRRHVCRGLRWHNQHPPKSARRVVYALRCCACHARTQERIYFLPSFISSNFFCAATL